jgi:hypothetical protein
MHTHPVIGETAPELDIAAWLQGEAVSLHDLRGKVVLVEVFQLNCPGCFLHALPVAADLHSRYAPRGLHVIGLATAFEDFTLNTLENLRLLVDNGELIGAPLQQLAAAGLLQENKIDFELPFAIAMDRLSENREAVDEASILSFINSQLDNYATLPAARQQQIQQQASDYLHARIQRAHSFERYQLQGTPSSIVIDREGILRDISFGRTDHLESLILPLLRS